MNGDFKSLFTSNQSVCFELFGTISRNPAFFHYRFNDGTDDAKRVAELSNRSFPRLEVAEHIESFMKRFPSSEAVIKSIDKLKSNNSLVVIGGQQAGILTGPLYSIHKVISIIKLAEQKEAQLGVPVIPVFGLLEKTMISMKLIMCLYQRTKRLINGHTLQECFKRRWSLIFS